MKDKIAWVCLVCAFLLSCSSKHQKPEPAVLPVAPVEKTVFPKGQVIPSVRCETDASQSFALYLPESYSDSVKYPVMIFFDPHGEGSLPLNRYRSLAERFGMILMGSNDSKNGLQFDQTNALAGNLIREAGSRFPADVKRIALAGFSGGAKVALVASSLHPELLAVIYCGAAVPLATISQIPPALGFAGLRDLNYAEVGNSSRELYEKKIAHALIEWEGKHEWPDAAVFEDAFYWCDFQSMRIQSIAINPATIRPFVNKTQQSLQHSPSAIAQVSLCTKAISFLQNIADVSALQKKLEVVTRSASFQSEMQSRQNLLQLENNLKENYAQCFESKDLSWWQQEIKRMRAVKGEQELMYQRLLGYLSLEAYSYSGNAIRQNDFALAQRFLGIYKLADPENSEQPFLQACLFARQGNQQQALFSLQEAVKLGLKDKAKIEAEESFVSLRSTPEFRAFLNSL